MTEQDGKAQLEKECLLASVSWMMGTCCFGDCAAGSLSLESMLSQEN